MDHGDVSFEEFAERWLVEFAGPPFHASYLVATKRSYLRQYLQPSLGKVRMSELSPRHVSQLQRELLAKGLSSSTVRHALSGVLAAIWKAARREGIVRGRLVADLRWPRQQGRTADPFSAEERDRIIRWFEQNSPCFVPLVACVFLAGMRPSEACGLRWRDIDPHSLEVHIARALACREVTLGKTRNSQRRIVVAQDLMDLIASARPSWAKPDDLIVTDSRNRPVNSKAWGDWHFRRALRALEIRHRRFYAARETYISLAMKEGANIAQVAEFCGTGIRTIEAYYFKWVGRLENPVETVRRARAAELERGRQKVPSQRPALELVRQANAPDPQGAAARSTSVRRDAALATPTLNRAGECSGAAAPTMGRAQRLRDILARGRVAPPSRRHEGSRDPRT